MHVHGVIKVIADPEELRQLVRATVRVFEREVGTGWDMNGSLEYFDRLLPGIGGSQMEIRGVDSMFKLSQEQPPQTVAKVVAAFRACPREQELADLVERAADGTA
ncbi:FMN-binding negative transcriptional regulator [Streptomyces sp. LZ34]